MTPKATIEANLVRGNAFFANMIADEINTIKFGVCSNPNACEETTNCLYLILDSLQFRVDNDLLDAITEQLYIEMMLIIGNYVIQIPPTANAGVNKTVGINDPVTFTGVGTPGSAPIVSVLWTQVSGAPLTLQNANTNTVTPVGYSSTGAYVLKYEVTDSNGLKGSDTVLLTVVNNITIRFGYSDTVPVPGSLAFQFSKSVPAGSSNYELNFTAAAQGKFLFIEEPSGEPLKINYFNTELNKNTIPGYAFFAPVILSGKRINYSRNAFVFQDPIYTIKFS